MFTLESKYSPKGDQPNAIKELTENFKNGEKYQTLLGVTGSGKTFTMANVIKNLGKKTLILAHNKTLAAQLYEEFRAYFPNNSVEYFVSYYDYYQPEAYVPGSDTYIEKDSSVNDDIDKLRHSATRSLVENEDVIVVSSVSCIYGIGAPEEYGNHRVKLFKGNKIVRNDLINTLIDIRFQRNDIDFSRGSFRIRGDLLEVFPSNEDEVAIRIEFFDDEIDSIHLVDPLRGKIIKELEKVVIYPTSHYVVSKEYQKRAIETIKTELRERLQFLNGEEKLVEASRLQQKTLLDLEMMEELGYCNGIENYSRHLTGSEPGEPPPTLIDFFGDDFLLIIDESHMTVPQVGGMYRGDRSRKETLVEHGFRLPSALDNRPLNFQEFESKYHNVLFVSATPGNYELEQTQGEVIEQIIRPTGLLDPLVEVRDSKNQVEDFLFEARKVIRAGFRVLITTLTKKLAEDLTEYYKSLGVKIEYLHSDVDTLDRVKILRRLRQGDFDILVGINLLREGLDLPEVSLVGIMDADREGFLRSTRALVQTIGRAARNDEGKVILYGLGITKSMKEAIDVTKERRAKQTKFNELNGIIPKTIMKEVKEGVLESLGKSSKSTKKKKKEYDLEQLSKPEIEKMIIDAQAKMKEHANNLEFEDALGLREEIKELKKLVLFY